MKAKRPRKGAGKNKRARKQTKPSGLWGRVISPIKLVMAGVLFLGGLAVWITDLTASVVEIAGLSLDYYGVEPEIVASEIDPRDPLRLPFTIINNSSWYTLYNVNPVCMFDATTDCYEITNAQATGNLPGLHIKGDIAAGKQVPFRCNIRIPGRQYRSLRVGVFVAYEVRPFWMLPIRKHETYQEFHAIRDSTSRPRWMPGPMLGETVRPFERRIPPPGEEVGLSMNFRGLPGCIREGEEPWFSAR